MGKFGFGSKSGDADEDSNRSGLFGRKKSSQSSQSAQNDNPYAQNSANDPYAAPMTPYQEVRARQAAGQRPGVGLPSGPRAGAGGPPPPYSSQQSQQPTGYGSEKYGTPGGYGSNRYADNAAAFQANRQVASSNPYASSTRSSATQRSGGYGGFGDEDANKDNLFGGARERAAKQAETTAANGYDTAPAVGSNGRYGDSSAYGDYGEERELTEEELEQRELHGIKNEINTVRNETKQTSGRILDRMDQIIDQGSSTLATMAGQNERLANTEKNLDLASIHNRRAEEKTRELKTLNRSMFAVHVGNPFTSKQRAAEREQKILDQHQFERSQRDATRKEAYNANQRMEDTFRDLRDMDQGGRGGAGTLGVNKMAERQKFMFEDDDDEANEEAHRTEQAIEDDIKNMSVKMGKIKYLAEAQSRETDASIKTIDRITAKSDAVDDGIRMNRTRLKPYE